MNQSLKAQAHWLFRQLRPHLGAHICSIALITLGSLMFLLDPLLIKWLIDYVLPRKDFQLLAIAALGFFAIYVFRLAFTTLAGIVSFRSVQDLVFRIRLSILDQMNLLSADYHETTPVGEKLYRMEQDVDQVAELGSSLVPYVLQTGFNAAFVIATMAVLNLRLTCIVLPLLPIFFLFRKYFDKRLRHASDIAQQCSSQESNFLQEHLAAIVQVQLLHQEQNQTATFIQRADDRMHALNRRNLAEMSFVACYMTIIALGTIAILGYGGYQVFVGALTVGGLVAFYSYMGRLFDPLHAAVDIYSRMNRLGASIRRILKVLETLPSVPDAHDSIILNETFQPRIAIKHVSFHYNHNAPVLEGLNLQMEVGEKVALVGISGSGKSTIAKLIARLYDAADGAIWVDGIDIRRIQLKSLRTKVCYLMQEPILFDRSLRENLLLGNPGATEEEMMDALETAELDSLLCRLPDGLDTFVGPGGKALSGGERQRVALARSVLQNPSLLILDESTSALDVPTERKIFMKLNRLFHDRSIVFISHRIAALTWVDRLVVLNKGCIEAQGTHEDLIQKSQTYKYLVTLPNEGFQPSPNFLRFGGDSSGQVGLRTVTSETLCSRSDT